MAVEQHFGAAEKAKLSGLAKGVHALWMSATPIPRTLAAGLAGFRDLRVIATPPVHRLPIVTKVAPLSDAAIAAALLREQRRHGQSFLICPRIQDLEPMLARVQSTAPDLRIVCLHGRLPAEDIDDRMMSFVGGEADVLFATNIVESGLDIPRANTIVVCWPEKFGLSQLHQLRGRVGRGGTRAFAYLLHELHNFALQQAKSVKDSIDISRYGILAANRRAEATEKTYDLAAESSRNRLRAYVSVLGISTQNAFEKNMSSSLNYKNVGQTPALGLRTMTDVVIISSSGSDVKPPRTYPTSYGGDNKSTIALGGGIAASDPFNNRAFKETELEEFRAGSKLYVVWGVLYYSDIFGKDHYTRFCRYFKFGEVNRWTFCQTDNDSN